MQIIVDLFILKANIQLPTNQQSQHVAQSGTIQSSPSLTRHYLLALVVTLCTALALNILSKLPDFVCGTFPSWVSV